nr:PREDICTED: taste receptor type 2 member 42-like [Bos indicus]
MSVGTRVFFLVVSTGELILGVLGNGFIGLVNCIAWVKNGKVSSADFILTCLAVARTILEVLWVTLLDSFIVGLAPHLYATGKLARVLEWGWALTNHLTIWFATCLSIFYFLKIASFSHFFFMWLKWRMNRVLLVLFLAFFFLLSFDLLMQDALEWIFFKLHWYEVMMFVMVIPTLFSSGHSFVIILGNSKLRQIAFRLLWGLTFSKN